MMKNLISLTGLLVLMNELFIGASARCNYFITTPDSVTVGSDIDISITVTKNGSGTFTLLAVLKNSRPQSIAGVHKTFKTKSGKTETLKLKVPNNSTIGIHQVEISSTGWIVFHKTMYGIELRKKKSFIFIQTDRPIYKPGDLVQFRVFGVNNSLNVLEDPLDVVIFDAAGNRVKQFMKVNQKFGVFGDSLKLSTLTNLGQWRIEANQMGIKHEVRFEVAEYELPTFEASIDVVGIPFIEDKYFIVRITALYTFGKPVEGYAYFKVYQSWRQDQPIIEKTLKILGKLDIMISTWDLYPAYGTSFSMFVKVNETVTGKEDEATESFSLQRSRWKVSFAPVMVSFKPGMRYSIIFRIEDTNGKPVITKEKAKIIIKIDYIEVVNKVSRTKTKILLQKDIRVDNRGIVELDVVFPINTTSARVYVVFKRQHIGTHYISKTTSSSDNFIQIRLKDKINIRVGKRIVITIETTERIKQCYYKILSKGNIVDQGRYKMKMKKRRHQRVIVTREMVPTARILVYYVRSNGEIVADAITFSVRGKDIFHNKVTTAFNKNTSEPGDKVTLYLTADPGSLVNVLAVDKSILLLRGANDVTADDVLRELKSNDRFSGQLRTTWGLQLPTPESGSTAKASFDNSRLRIVTDCNLSGTVQRKTPVPRTMMSSTMALATMATTNPLFFSSNLDSASSSGISASFSPPAETLQSPARKRSNFPETWLWLNTTTSVSGIASLVVTVPDTITEWITSAFAVNPQTGLGVSPTQANITTFQRFFTRLELPYSVIRGEVLILKISVFNYLNEDLQVFVGLEKNENLTFLDQNENVLTIPGNSWIKTIDVPKDSVKSIHFPLIPNRIGETTLEVTSRSTKAADAVKRTLLVKPEGIRQQYNLPVTIDLRENRDFKSKFSVDFPPETILGSEFVMISVTGDQLGSTLNGIDDLLQMSYGCGEQNMLKFVPNVFIAEYLNVTNRLTKKLNEKIEKILADGYQRQLTYVHRDGSFSAFGKSDRYGSTCTPIFRLTAFVLKSFAQAAKFTFIDKYRMERATEFLIRQQRRDGSYSEKGNVLHKAMQGGSASGTVSLTAYVVIALKEALSHNQVPNFQIARTERSLRFATDYLVKTLIAKQKLVFKPLYELVLSTYALSLQNASLVESLLGEIEKSANTTDGQLFWILSDDEADSIQPYRYWSPPRKQVRALDIEVTAYMLLIFNVRNDIGKGVRILKWLNSQRNPYGGFISTQDTVITIQALSGLAGIIYSPKTKATVKMSGNGWAGETRHVDNDNALVWHSVDVPPNTSKLSITATGYGFLFAEISVFFNVPDELRKPAFFLDVFLRDESLLGFKLQICFGWLRGNISTMGYLEISSPSGMGFNLESVNTTETEDLFRKKETVNKQLHMYFDGISKKRMCVEVRVERINLVIKQKPVPIRISEYYEQSNEVIRLYQSAALADASLDEVCNQADCQ